MQISISSPEKIPAFIELLEEAGAWLWEKGIRQWKPGIHRISLDMINDLVENGWLVLAYQEDKLAGGCVLSRCGPGFWLPDSHALYVHKLAAARFVAGKGVGREVIHFCIQFATALGYSAIRLDCWDGNDFLKTYYQEAGFNMLNAVPEEDYRVRLFEWKI